MVPAIATADVVGGLFTVTGGLGGLGLLTAKLLAGLGVARLLLPAGPVCEGVTRGPRLGGEVVMDVGGIWVRRVRASLRCVGRGVNGVDAGGCARR